MANFFKRIFDFLDKTDVIKPENNTFKAFYYETVDLLYKNTYTRVHNHIDTLSVLIDTYIIMYQKISQLRRAPSVRWWIRQKNTEGYRKAMSSRNLRLSYDTGETEDYPVLTNEQKEEFWQKLLKIYAIDEFLTVPLPNADAREEKGFLGPLIYRYKSIPMLTKLKFFGAIICIAVMITGGIFVWTTYSAMLFGDEVIQAHQEIFLPDSSYSDFKIGDEDIHLDRGRIMNAVKNARDRAVQIDSLESKVTKTTQRYFDPEWESMPVFGPVPSVAPMEGIGKAEGNRILTGDDQFDAELLKTVDYITSSSMSDREKIAAIYNFVCNYGEYISIKNQSPEYITQAKDFFINGGGDSNNYSAAFKALCNICGYQADIVRGEFIIGDSLIEHTWAKITLNGIEYHFDPEADCSADGVQIRSYYFMASRGNSRWEVFTRDHRWV